MLYEIEEAFLPFSLEDILTTESIYSHLETGYGIERGCLLGASCICNGKE
jgi:hypothetical protein